MTVRNAKVFAVLSIVFVFLGCAGPRRQAAKTAVGVPGPVFFEEGTASWYGPGFAGRRTASGERFNPNEMTCAHRTLPFGFRLKVTNLSNGAAVIVTVNDRGPAIRSRIVDLSRAAARGLGFLGAGIAEVRIEPAPFSF